MAEQKKNEPENGDNGENEAAQILTPAQKHKNAVADRKRLAEESQ